MKLFASVEVAFYCGANRKGLHNYNFDVKV
jgi:hypothetical protein